MQGIKTQLNYGAIGGLVGFAFFLIFYIINGNPFGNIGWVSFWVPALFMYLGAKKIREEESGNVMTYWRAFMTCLTIAILQAALYNMMTYLFGMLVDQSFVQAYINDALKGIDQAKSFLPKDKLAGIVDKIKNMSLSELAFGDFQNKLFGGLFVSIILAFILKREQDRFQDVEEIE